MRFVWGITNRPNRERIERRLKEEEKQKQEQIFDGIVEQIED